MNMRSLPRPCRPAVVAATLLTLFTSSVFAQVTLIESDGTQPNIYRMTVSPAAEPRPALKFHFLVPPVDQIHENAATLYYKAMTHAEEQTAFRHYMELESDDEKWQALYEGPLDKLPQKEVEDYVGWYRSIAGSLREAAKCDHCDWMDDIRQHGISTLLPQAQASRTDCNVLALLARLQIAQKKFDEAIDMLLAGYAWSRNLGHSPTLVQCLIGMAFQGLLDEQTAALIAAENSPNLYWALTDLAAEPVDLRQALSFESRVLEFTFHSLAEIDQRILTAEESLRLINDRLPEISSRGIRNLGVTFFGALQLQPEARKYLLGRGYTTEKLDAMPVLQEVLLYRWKQFEIIRDNYFKWLQVPDDELATALPRADEEVKAAVARGEGRPFTDVLPAIHAVYYARLRTIRFTNMLRIVEALRMYAADHGRWPERLSDITAVPMPIDTYSKKPFQYSVKDGVATLEPPAGAELPGGPAASRRYELTLRKP